MTATTSRASLASRARVLDSARGLAVVSVVAYHCFTLTVVEARPDGGVGVGWAALGAGSLGVDLFFVLSGFLLVGSWRASRRRHGPSYGGAVADYGRRRLLRIVPAYWASLLVLVPLTAPALLAAEDWARRLALLTTLQQYVDKDLPGQVNLVYWSLTTEVHFYLLLPLLSAVLLRVRGRVLLPACLILAVAWRLWAPGHLPESWIFGRLDQFVAGMAAAGLVAAADAGQPGRIVRAVADRRMGAVLGVLLAGVGLYHGARYSLAGAQP